MSVWRTWWLGDMGGDLLVAPFLLLIASGSVSLGAVRARVAEASALLIVLVTVSLLTFTSSSPLAYLTFPMLIWAALRFRQVGAAAASLIVAAVAIGLTANGMGPFVQDSPDASLLLSQTFVGVAGAVALLLAAVTTERERAKQELTRAQGDLEQKVRDRTAALAQSEENARRIVEAATDAFVSIDSSGAIVEWNPRAEAVFGWARGEALGRPLADTIVPERFRAAHKHGLGRFLATSTALGASSPQARPTCSGGASSWRRYTATVTSCRSS